MGNRQALVGRQQELTLLQARYGQLSTSNLDIVLIAGEPGIGKSRLLNEFADWCAHAGATVLYGSATEAEGMPSYLPFLQALGSYLRTNADDTLCQILDIDAAVLVGLFPELGRYVDRLFLRTLPPEQSRLRLYEAFSALLAAISTSTPLILLLDDLQWADPASLDLLCYLAKYHTAPHLLIVGTCRQAEGEQNAAFRRALTELNRLRKVTILALSPLTLPEVAELCESYLGASVQPVLPHLLYDQSEGNPYFAEELLYDWRRTGILAQTSDGWRLNVHPDKAQLPPTIIAAMKHRLEHIAPEIVDTLSVAAVIGRNFHLLFLAQVLGKAPEQVEPHILEACKWQLLLAQSDLNYTFSHDKIRECLLSDIAPLRLRRWHGAIGQVLEADTVEQNSQQLARLAFHFSHSGDAERGASYARTAGEQAMLHYAFEEAMAHFVTALDLAGTTNTQRGPMLRRFGEAAVLAGKEQEAITAFTSAQDWYQAAGDQHSAAVVAHLRGKALWRLEALPDARTAFETTIRLLRDSQTPDMVNVLVDLASLLAVSLFRHTEGFACAERALYIAQKLEDDQLIAKTSRTVGNILVRDNRLKEGLALLERGLNLAISIGDLVEAAECCALLTMTCFWSADIQRSYDYLQRQLGFAQQCHDPFQLRHIYTNLAMYYIIKGQFDESQHMLEKAHATVDELSNPEARAILHLYTGWLAYNRGDYPTAENLMSQGIALLRSIGTHGLIWYLGLLGPIYLAQDKRQEALACVVELDLLLAALPVGSMPTSEPLHHLIMIALELRDEDRLMRYADRLKEFAGQGHDALTDRLLGMVATRRGDWNAAHKYLAAAETIARQQGLSIELIETLLARAELALVQGSSTSTVHSLAEQAAILAQQIGYMPCQPHIRALLHKAPTELPAGLSAREVDVLRLVALGKTNRQIAEALFISEKTVEKHLTSIFTKTGTDNRAGATAFAYKYQFSPPR